MKRIEPMSVNHDFTPPLRNTSISDILENLQKIMNDTNTPTQTAVGENDIELSLSEQTAAKIKRANADMYQHALGQLRSIKALVNAMEAMLEQKQKETDEKTDEICQFVGDMLNRSAQIAESVRQLGLNLVPET